MLGIRREDVVCELLGLRLVCGKGMKRLDRQEAVCTAFTQSIYHNHGVLQSLTSRAVLPLARARGARARVSLVCCGSHTTFLRAAHHVRGIYTSPLIDQVFE